MPFKAITEFEQSAEKCAVVLLVKSYDEIIELKQRYRWSRLHQGIYLFSLLLIHKIIRYKFFVYPGMTS